MIDPAVAATAKDVLSTVVSSGTGENAATGEPTWGKTGTTDDNGDAWFCGATKEITACVWVGHADSVTPMETEFAGAPVDGGTYPALIFADVVNAYDEVQAAHDAAGEDPEPSEADVPPAPAAPAPPVEAADTGTAEVGPVEEAATAEPAVPSGDAAGGSTGGAPAPSGGGIAPG